MTERGLFQTGEPEEINIRALVIKYLRYWHWFALSAGFCLIAAFAYLRYQATPQYHISSTLLIKNDQGNSSLGENGSVGLKIFGMNSNIKNEIVMLKSRSLMQRVLEEISLHVSYYAEGRFRDAEIYKEDIPITLIISKLDALAFGKSVKIHIQDHNNFDLYEEDQAGELRISHHKFGQEVSKPYASFTLIASSTIASEQNYIIRFHDIRKLAESYSQNLVIEPINKESSVLSINLTDAVPQRGVEIINQLVEAYNQEAIEDKNQVAASTVEFLDERIQFLSTELLEVEKTVEEYKQKNDLTDVSSNAEMYLERASEYNKQLTEYEIRIDVLNSIEDYLKNEELELVPSSLNIDDPTLNGLIAKFNELQLERQRLLRTIQPNSSLILNMDDQLANLRQNIIENLRNIKNGLMITRDNLQASSARFEYRIQRVPSIERELLEINRQQSIKQEIYLFLLQKREEAGLTLASTTANSRIVDSAKAGDYPVSPKKSAIYLGALMLGLFLPFSFIYLKDMLNDKVRGIKDVEKVTATPILGEIAHSRLKTSLVVSSQSYTPTAELFRLIRANLQFAALDRDNKVILITSSMSGEGKTFFSINLGASLALAGKKVAVISFDLRKPKLMQSLGMTDKVGVSNYIVDPSLSIEKMIVPSPVVPNLYLLGSGSLPPNPAELMMSQKVSRLMDELRSKFDYVIIDSSPVGQVADSFALAPLIDSCIYIVRYDFTRKNQLTIVNDIYRNHKLRNPMIVLNDAKSKHEGYGYGYGYRYGYKNGAVVDKDARRRGKIKV